MNKTRFVPAANPETIAFNIKDLRSLVFEVTDDCNLQFKYCAYSEFYYGYDKREDSYLSFSKAKVLIDHHLVVGAVHPDSRIHRVERP